MEAAVPSLNLEEENNQEAVVKKEGVEGEEGISDTLEPTNNNDHVNNEGEGEGEDGDLEESFREALTRPKVVGPQTGKVMKLLSNYRRLVTAQRTKIRSLQEQLVAASKQGPSAPMKGSERAMEKIRRVLSQNQIDFIVFNKKNIKWTEEELVKALTLRYLNKVSYNFVVQELNIPLPGTYSLKKWGTKFRYKGGVLEDVLRLLKGFSESLNEYERSVILQVDEMRVRTVYEHDKLTDQLLGPHSSMLVIIARALFDSYKEIVYLNFDVAFNFDLINDIIVKLHEVNISVVGLSAKWDPTNFLIWQEINVSPEKSWFFHPLTEEKVYLFGDTNYCILELRNWLVQTGFTLGEGQVVDKEPLEDLVKETELVEDKGHLVTLEHLRLTDGRREELRLILELLSHSTANALFHFSPGSDPKRATDTATFVDLVNAWYDIMNTTYSSKSNLMTQSAFGTQFEEQDAFLQDVFQTFSKLRCVKTQEEEGLLIFQVALLMSITSLREMYKEVHAKYGVNFILTQKFNLNCMDDYWKGIRADVDVLSPQEAVERTKSLIIAKIRTGRGRLRPGDSEHFVTSKMFKEAGVIMDVADLELPKNSDPELKVSAEWAEQEEMERWMKYMSGYLAYRLRDSHAELGKEEVSTHASEDHSYSGGTAPQEVSWTGPLPPWLVHMALPVILEPRASCLRIVQELELCFQNHHKNGTLVSTGKGLTGALTKHIQAIHPQIPVELVAEFVQARTKARINYLNHQLLLAALAEQPEEMDTTEMAADA